MPNSPNAEEATPRSNRVLTFPNVISALRLVLALVLPFVEARWRLPLLIAGALSDWLDGLLAKYTNARSTIGQLLDPIADKALLLSAMVTITVAGDIQWWQAALVMARDFAVAIVGATAAIRRDWWAFGRMKPAMIGKITTVFACMWLVAVLISQPWAQPIRWPAFLGAAVCSVLTAAVYLTRFARELRLQRRNALSGP